MEHWDILPKAQLRGQLGSNTLQGCILQENRIHTESETFIWYYIPKRKNKWVKNQRVEARVASWLHLPSPLMIYWENFVSHLHKTGLWRARSFDPKGMHFLEETIIRVSLNYKLGRHVGSLTILAWLSGKGVVVTQRWQWGVYVDSRSSMLAHSCALAYTWLYVDRYSKPGLREARWPGAWTSQEWESEWHTKWDTKTSEVVATAVGTVIRPCSRFPLGREVCQSSSRIWEVHQVAQR